MSIKPSIQTLPILNWFGLRFEPRFTTLDDQLKELRCAADPALYEKCLVRPVGQIDVQVTVDEKSNLDQIVATLGLKEITQGALIRKLCTYIALNATRRVIFEFDKLVRALSEPHRVLPPAALADRTGRRQKN